VLAASWWSTPPDYEQLALFPGSQVQHSEQRAQKNKVIWFCSDFSTLWIFVKKTMEFEQYLAAGGVARTGFYW